MRPTLVLLASKVLGNECKLSEGRSIKDVETDHLTLAQIVEMIHTASLAHDDVLDDADVRRNAESMNKKYGSKFSILAGDFLLSKASVALSGLRNHNVTTVMSKMIADLVEGEFMQSRPLDLCDFDGYLQKIYLKIGSLISSSLRSAALISNSSEEVVEAMSNYGRNLGLAFQITDDVLDFTGSSKEMG